MCVQARRSGCDCCGVTSASWNSLTARTHCRFGRPLSSPARGARPCNSSARSARHVSKRRRRMPKSGGNTRRFCAEPVSLSSRWRGMRDRTTRARNAASSSRFLSIQFSGTARSSRYASRASIAWLPSTGAASIAEVDTNLSSGNCSSIWRRDSVCRHVAAAAEEMAARDGHRPSGNATPVHEAPLDVRRRTRRLVQANNRHRSRPVVPRGSHHRSRRRRCGISSSRSSSDRVVRDTARSMPATFSWRLMP